MQLDHTRYNLPGVYLAVKEADQAIQYFSSGFADVAKQLPFAPERLFRVGHITRIFTAVLVLRLVEQGLLDLAMPLEQLTTVHKADNGLLHLLVQQYPFLKPVSTQELLLQTSGLPSFDRALGFHHMFLKKPKKKFQIENYLDAISGMAARYQSGYLNPARGRFSESTTNYFLAGLVIEAVMGVPVSHAMSQLFADNNLGQTEYLSYGMLPKNKLAQMVRAYLPPSHPYATAFMRSDTLEYNHNKELKVFDVTADYGAYGMANAAVVSSAHDLVTWMHAINTSEVIVKHDMLFPAALQVSTTVKEDHYAMGMYKTRFNRQTEVVWTAGNSLGYGALLLHLPSSQKTAIVVSNVSRTFFSLHADGLVADVLAAM